MTYDETMTYEVEYDNHGTDMSDSLVRSQKRGAKGMSTAEKIEQSAYVVSEVRFLAGTDTADRLARRLGFKGGRQLNRFLYRQGEKELAREFNKSALRPIPEPYERTY